MSDDVDMAKDTVENLECPIGKGPPREYIG